jgi:hypothetical protein
MTDNEILDIAFAAGLRFDMYAGDAALRANIKLFARAVEFKIVEDALAIIATYKVPVGNSAAGEMAADWTMEALADIYGAVAALKEQK